MQFQPPSRGARVAMLAGLATLALAAPASADPVASIDGAGKLTVDFLGVENVELAGDPGGFFATLLEYTRQGMFADPIHGGNAGFAGWDLIGYPG